MENDHGHRGNLVQKGVTDLGPVYMEVGDPR